MLVRCSNPDCTIEFADSLSACPVCQAPPEQAAASAAYEARRQDVVAAENGRVLLVSLFVLTIAVNLILFGMLRSKGIDSTSNVTLFRLIIEIGMMFDIFKGGETIRIFWVFSAGLGLLVAIPLVLVRPGCQCPAMYFSRSTQSTSCESRQRCPRSCNCRTAGTETESR